MQLWTDAHLSPQIATWMRTTFGVTATAVRDLGLADAEDPVIFAAARTANAVVMTKDRDFVELLARQGPPPRVLWLTCGNTSNAALRTILHRDWTRVVALLDGGESLVEISDRAS